MTESEIRLPANTSALRAKISGRRFLVAWAVLMLAFVAASVPIAVTFVLAVTLALGAIAAFPPRLFQAASGQEPLLTLGPDGFTYSLYSYHRIPWAQIAETTLEVISEEQPDKARPARRQLGQDELIMTLKSDTRRMWPRRIVIKPHYLAVDLETLVAAIETHWGREVTRIERLLPPSRP